MIKELIIITFFIFHFVLTKPHNRMKLVKKYALDQSQIVVIGNKTDLPNKRRLSKEDGMQLAASYGVKFMEVNVPHEHNIQKMLNRLAVNLSK